ncbi:beta-1,3-galactosyl-O-glycosyl-glycoprotein beta-1,6-N-acetylglucosaminyltransferase [Elysia marginata]|uniref:Beta-1,3-galactosyl-O-glycosyl-glycoprotein beta-1,6-N-acetylglucosaminyltransferase n=1 Tax=Elysia marginata TaxID=1093978 RepID=A0AAV4GIA0_9GAST|nr:beta-1,3-galactosyl-O-glycosyl-glycoprotein beta-1,6-N-acetylglucosaminyltransferase [Elysia marginata]
MSLKELVKWSKCLKCQQVHSVCNSYRRLFAGIIIVCTTVIFSFCSTQIRWTEYMTSYRSNSVRDVLDTADSPKDRTRLDSFNYSPLSVLSQSTPEKKVEINLRYSKYTFNKSVEFLIKTFRHYQQTRVNCSALFSGDKVEIEKDIAVASMIAKDEKMAERMHRNPKSTKSNKYFADKLFESEVEKWSWGYKRLTNQWYINATKDCQAFKRTRGYIMSPLTREEGEFPIAFSIVAFKDVEMVERLLRILYRPQNRYCIHVDSKADVEFYSALKAVAACFPGNVRMSSRRVDVRWGTFTVLEPELICMQDLWDMDNNFNLNAGTSQNSVRNEQQNKKKWKYFINLTGQEFPLKTNFELVQILKTFKGANHEEGTRKRANGDRWQSTPPHGIIPTKGGVHTLLNR